MTQPPTPTPPAKPAGRSGLSRWVATHQAQAAGIAAVVGVVAIALWRKHKAGKGASPAAAAVQNTGSLAPTYDPTSGQYIDPVSGSVVPAPTLSGLGSPVTAGGMPSGPDPSTQAQLAELQAELAALGAGYNGYGAPPASGTAGATSGATPGMTGASGAPAPSPPRLYYGMAATPTQARQLDPNIGASAASDAPYLAGGTTLVQQRIQQIAQNRGITLTPAQLGALANRVLAPQSSSGYLSLDMIRSQIDQGGSAY